MNDTKNHSISPTIATNGESNHNLDVDNDAVILSTLTIKAPSYAQTKESATHSRIKSLLSSGEFESALSLAEKGIGLVLSKANGNELHESLAPLYYLYGTTLLYSVEEGTAGDSMSSVMTARGESGPGQEGAEDLEIAWENLESARSSLSRIAPSRAEEEDEPGRELILDLAQIHLRLGDLSRHNGRYEEAISDFERCLRGRRVVLDPWDRRIADANSCLASTFLLIAGEGEKKLGAASESEGATEDAEPACPRRITECRELSIMHYLECGRILGGIIGKLCGVDPSKINDDALEEGTNDKKESLHSSPQAESVIPSKNLSNIRHQVATLTPSKLTDKDEVHDLKEMLDEIQETIDNAVTDAEGLRKVGLMRKRAEQAADAASNENSETVDKPGLTTIGFGSGSSSSVPISKTESSQCFDSTASTIDVATVPTMLVKKKKKRVSNTDCLADSKKGKIE